MVFKIRQMVKLYDITEGVSIDRKRLKSRTEQTLVLRHWNI